MDSGNSSSMQSSSGGGEEEYDSRADHFFNHRNSSSSASAPRTATLYHHHHDNIGSPLPDPHPPPHHLDPLLSNYFTNLDTLWSSKTVRPGPDLSVPPLEPVVFTNPTPLPHPRPNSTSGSVPSGGDDNNKNGGNNNNMARNPKKRSRASRRAPTTVLTTDTTNFRAMVQEFTGVPAPPFTGSSSFTRTGRFDLFGSSPNSSFPLKPFAQKLIPPLFLSSSSSPSASSTAAMIASSSSPSSLSYHLPYAEHQNLLNTNTQSIVNNFLDIQPPKDPITDPTIFAAKSKPLFDPSSQHIKVGNALDEFGHFGINFGGLQSVVSSSSTSTLMHRNKNSDTENVEADLLRSINGGFSESVLRAPSYRATATAAAASSGSSASPENNIATARNEGMVESWICSSD